MATIAPDAVRPIADDDGFFRTSAFLMALVLVAGFSVHLSMGRSTFDAPLLLHAHALVFFGWVVIYCAQSWFATRGPMALHRRLGWLSVGWIVAMVVLGLAVTAFRARNGEAPPIFQPQHFLVANPLVVLLFAGLTAAAIVKRRQTDWHRRLHVCGMAALTGPGFGRLLPMPLLIPWAYQIAALVALVFPIAGMVVDLRRRGRIHPAWWWGVGATLATMLLTEAIVYSPIGDALYRVVTAGAPGQAVPPLAFPPMAGP